ncbi:MAG: hypothetical protein A3C06_02785 [Candidatus Taylorbacteria bacterium RIFCSPHIGHO2_02_FULL_46_13]|uniref:Glycosyl transferase family 1 domain-containing protein n=1 Tax=Candidatus Taylorbacteria bacterium RIFCSPHIGHO2_02_FULL_46_13 TaxID=1802312 RepID=A0A1G2MRJ6_9BACT|nr:MAG: hypothetical protein A3C06_02785 [Candidatus Taylorbacteria bacterium RIFCSPHIGHO2_02_FULL_46_13]
MTHKKIAYIGIYPATAPRDKVYIDELKRRGVEFVECVGTGAGMRKYIQLYRNLNSLRDADLVWVGYLSTLAVIVAYLATRKKILYNALCSSYESYILDRAMYSKYSFRSVLFWVSDFLSFHLASISLVESESQKRFISRVFFVSKKRLHVVYTGADESIFYPDQSTPKAKDFTVVFRGKFVPATGVEFVVEAARILAAEPIKFLIIGWGQEQEKIEHLIRSYTLTNIELITSFLSPADLHQRMLSGHVLLGQFSTNSRLDRTIQHKTIEAMALGMPYITRDSVSNREILTDGEDCLFVQPADARNLAEKIIYCMKRTDVWEKISAGARNMYEARLQQSVLGEHIKRIIASPPFA